MQCDQCLHVTNTAAKSYTPTNPFPTHTGMSNCTAFPLYAIVSGHRKTLYKSHKFAAVANGSLNQFYLVKGGPGIIALPSFLYIQSCRVTAFGISLCRISLTNLPLLLHGWYKSHQFAALAVHRCHFLDWEG